MKHRGEIIEKAIRESGIPITEIARRVRKSRQWVYNLFENPTVSLDIVNQIGKLISRDLLSEMELSYTPDKALLDGEEKYVRSGSVTYWKDKYYSLLEEHMELIKKIKELEN